MSPRAKAVYRSMTDDEQRMAIALGNVTMIPGIPSKALARKLADVARSEMAVITEAQAASLRSLTRRYRRQIPAAVVALAGPPPTQLPQHDTSEAADGRASVQQMVAFVGEARVDA